MSYTIQKNDSGEHCVHKKNDDGSTGKMVKGGCHKIKQDAIDMIAAIESSEAGKKGLLNTSPVNIYINTPSETSSDNVTIPTIFVDDDYEIHIDSDDHTQKKDVRPEVGGGVDVDKLKDSDFVLPKERAFPIVTAKDVKDAVSSWGRYKGKSSFETFKKNLTALAKRKGFSSSLPKEWMKKDSKKSMDIKGLSLDQIRIAVDDAWYAENSGMNLYIHEIFFDDGFIIVSSYSGGNKHTHYKVPFSANEDYSEFEFAPKTEWMEVKLSKEWVEKSFRLSDRLGFAKFIIEDSADDLDIDARYAVKALGKNRLGAYGVLWGDPDDKDLHEEFFTPETKDTKSIFDAMGKLPLIVHHAADDKVKTFVYGEVDVLEEDDEGIWWEGKIKEFEVYQEYVQPLLDRRALFSSSGTLPAAKRKNKKSGEITRWPIAEMTTTWLPAEWRMLERPVEEIKAAYKAIDLNCDLSDYDDTQEQEAEGAEKARLKAIVMHHISELDLLETTLE